MIVFLDFTQIKFHLMAHFRRGEWKNDLDYKKIEEPCLVSVRLLIIMSSEH